MAKILIVEDEKSILRGLVDNLKAEGYDVISSSDGQEGLKLAHQPKIDLIILDVMLPKMNGYDILKELKKKEIQTPVIMLTAKQKELDKVLGLELGADDYITKPFSIGEFLARVKAVLRRSKSSHYAGAKAKLANYQFGDVKIDFRKFQAYCGHKRMNLTKREIEILEYLIRRKGEVITRDDLLSEVWGYEEFPSTRTIDNFIARLRKAIEKSPSEPTHILSIRGVGYKFME